MFVIREINLKSGLQTFWQKPTRSMLVGSIDCLKMIDIYMSDIYIQRLADAGIFN